MTISILTPVLPSFLLFELYNVALKAAIWVGFLSLRVDCLCREPSSTFHLHLEELFSQ